MSVRVDVKLYATGYCEHRGAITMKGDSWSRKKYPAICTLLRLPSGKNVLFDTGYTTAFYRETRRFPNSLYAALTPVTVQPEDSLLRQLRRDGIDAKDIDTIILSHFHADHMCGLKDFPSALIVGCDKSYERVRSLRGFSAVRKGYLPGLLPDDFEFRFGPIEATDTADLSDELPGFTFGYDLFADSSLFAVPLPGHAKGQFGLYFHDIAGRPTFLIADATWSSRAYRENRKPRLPAYAAFDSRLDYDQTFDRLHSLYLAKPEIRMIPCHCEDVWKEITG